MTEHHEPQHTHHEHAPQHVITVNRKPYTVTGTTITPRQILTLAHLDVTHHRLERKEHGQLHPYSSLDEDIPLHGELHFIATYTGSTPVS